ncbi:MAG: hypothetical protein J3Q66DRAFT_339404 [Benniella sp.]|nr:MAG: hypothetical protein J3Q66DRAFT_339404 [Benniella sp.]
MRKGGVTTSVLLCVVYTMVYHGVTWCNMRFWRSTAPRGDRRSVGYPLCQTIGARPRLCIHQKCSATEDTSPSFIRRNKEG